MAKRANYPVRPDGLHESRRMINGVEVTFCGSTDKEVDRKITEYKDQIESGRLFLEDLIVNGGHVFEKKSDFESFK
jgi:hypothetical protein